MPPSIVFFAAPYPGVIGLSVSFMYACENVALDRVTPTHQSMITGVNQSWDRRSAEAGHGMFPFRVHSDCALVCTYRYASESKHAKPMAFNVKLQVWLAPTVVSRVVRVSRNLGHWGVMSAIRSFWDQRLCGARVTCNDRSLG